MKKYLISVTSFALFALATSSQAVLYDFAAEGNEHEAGYATFVSDNHSAANPAHTDGTGLPPGLTITASNGTGLNGAGATLYDGAAIPTYDPPSMPPQYYAYFDANTSSTNTSRNAGLGVCKAELGNCAGISDDNHMPGEYIHMDFDNVEEILSLDITGNHVATASTAVMHYSLDEGSTWNMLSIGNQLHGSFLSLAAVLGSTWVTDTLDYTITGGEMYLSAMELSEVPVPAAFWLFGTALLGFISFSRRTKV